MPGRGMLVRLTVCLTTPSSNQAPTCLLEVVLLLLLHLLLKTVQAPQAEGRKAGTQHSARSVQRCLLPFNFRRTHPSCALSPHSTHSTHRPDDHLWYNNNNNTLPSCKCSTFADEEATASTRQHIRDTNFVSSMSLFFFSPSSSTA